MSLFVGASFRNNGGFGGVVRRFFLLTFYVVCVCGLSLYRVSLLQRQESATALCGAQFAPTLRGEQTCCSAVACQVLAVYGPEDCLRSSVHVSAVTLHFK